MTPEKLAKSFWNRVEKTPTCWIWKGAKGGKNHYGQLERSGRKVRAYRLAYGMEVGPIPDGICVLHRCDVPLCVRPDHLFLGTKKDNMADCVAKKRNARGETHGRTKHSRRDVRFIRKARAAGFPAKFLAEKFAYTEGSISEVACRKKWI